MRSIISLFLLNSLFLLFPIVVLAQRYSETIQVSGKNSEQLYRTAREWVWNNVKTLDDEIISDNMADRKMVVKGIRGIEYDCLEMSSKLDISFNLILEFSDNTLKYDLCSTNLQVFHGLKFNYEQLRDTTVEGIIKIYEQNNMKYFAKRLRKKINKKGTDKNCEACFDCQKNLIGYVENEMQLISSELINSLKGTLK